MGRVDIDRVCSLAGRPAGELTRRDIARGLLEVPARDALSSLPRLRRQLLAAGRPQSAAFWDRTERTLSAIADATATYGMVRTWLEATGTEPTQMVGGFVWPDESDRGPVATEMHARLVAHLEGLVAAGEVDPDRLLAGDAVALAAHEQAQVDWLHTELEDGRQPIWAVSDEEDEWLLAAWADADADAQQILTELLDGAAPRPCPRTELRAAARRLREALPRGRWPHDLLRSLLGGDPGTMPDDDEELWLALATAVVDGGHGPPLDGRLDEEALAAWMSLQHADWIGAVVRLVTVGPGAVADGEALAHHAATFDFEAELEGDPPHDPEILDAAEPWEWDAWWDDRDGGYDAELGLRIGFEIVARLWQALGAVDDDQRLTDLGWWGLPEALHRAWGGTADATE